MIFYNNLKKINNKIKHLFNKDKKDNKIKWTKSGSIEYDGYDVNKTLESNMEMLMQSGECHFAEGEIT